MKHLQSDGFFTIFTVSHFLLFANFFHYSKAQNDHVTVYSRNKVGQNSTVVFNNYLNHLWKLFLKNKTRLSKINSVFGVKFAQNSLKKYVDFGCSINYRL